jgi:hypothetical protein
MFPGSIARRCYKPRRWRFRTGRSNGLKVQSIPAQASGLGYGTTMRQEGCRPGLFHGSRDWGHGGATNLWVSAGMNFCFNLKVATGGSENNSVSLRSSNEMWRGILHSAHQTRQDPRLGVECPRHILTAVFRFHRGGVAARLDELMLPLHPESCVPPARRAMARLGDTHNFNGRSWGGWIDRALFSKTLPIPKT